MLIAITIMIFLILVIVSLHYNDHAKVVVRLQNELEEQLEKQTKILGSIEHNTRKENR